MHKLEEIFSSLTCQKSRGMCANCRVGQGANVSIRVWVKCADVEQFFFLLFTLPMYVRV